MKDEIGLEFSAILKSLGLQVHSGELKVAKAKVDDFNREIRAIMGGVINSTDLKNKIELLKLEVAKAGGMTTDSEPKAKI